MYEALYRKYRPHRFDDVSGQEHITETLKMQVRTGRLSHAYLFIGTRGTGKTTCARILAKAVNCEHPVDGNPCNECRFCRGMDDGSLTDVVEMDAASNTGVDDVRMLRDEAVFSPTTARKRVYIIDEVHMLSKAAFNALLKILEEPPEHLMFILATTELNKVLPTILSRCQRHSFRRLTPEIIASRLDYVAQQEHMTLTSDAALLLGRLADGGMRDGLSLLDQCSAAQGEINTGTVLSVMGLAGSLRTMELARHLMQRDVEGALSSFRALWQDGKEPVSLLSELASLYRDALLLRLAPQSGTALLSGSYTPEMLSELTADGGSLLHSLDLIQKYQTQAREAQNPRLPCELCLIALCGVEAAIPAACAPAAANPAASRTAAADAGINTGVRRGVNAAAASGPASDQIEKPETESAAEPADEPPAQDAKSVTAHDPSVTVMSWGEILNALENRLFIGIYAMLTDDSLVRGRIEGDELILEAGIAAEKTLQQSEVAEAIREVSGLRMRVVPMRTGQAVGEDKIDVLSRFSNVTIK